MNPTAYYPRPLLLSWLDVERRLREMTGGFSQLPTYLANIYCYADGAELILTEAGHDAELRQWLSDVFDNALDPSESDLLIHLEIEDTAYPFMRLIQPEKQPTQRLHYPLWHDLAYLSADQPGISSLFQPPEQFPEALRIAVFHSFKGGVGRTTALMVHLAAYLESAKKRPVKVLVIDADIEAPGITYWLDEAHYPRISFVRFLESVHYPTVSVEKSIDYLAAELKKYALTLHGTHEVLVLPACINPKQAIELLDTPVLPEHLARSTKNPWSVGDAIQQLASALGANLVLIDLRAGLSELASPLLFDPRIERFIVSTINQQSINGTALVLEKMAAIRGLAPVQDQSTAIPTVILSLLTPALRESVAYDEAIQRFSSAYPNPHAEDDDSPDVISPGIEIIEAAFDPGLMSIPNFSVALDLAKRSSLFAKSLQWAESLLVEKGEQNDAETAMATALAKLNLKWYPKETLAAFAEITRATEKFKGLFNPEITAFAEITREAEKFKGLFNPEITEATKAIVAELQNSKFAEMCREIEKFNFNFNEVVKGTTYDASTKAITREAEKFKELFNPKKEPAQDYKEQAQKLKKLCEGYIYADHDIAQNWLITDPLRNLAKHHEESLPTVLCLGNKGAGKTFNFLQLCRLQSWKPFLTAVGVTTGDQDNVLVFPFLESKNLSPAAKKISDNCRSHCYQRLGITRELLPTELATRINTAILNPQTDWTQFWIGELLAAFDLTSTAGLKDLSNFLATHQTKTIILIDGLEDQFPNPGDTAQQPALEALLRLPNNIDEIRGSHLGLIEFVRSDYVRTVIQQNAAQLETRYKPFALEWTAESFLRLAYWLCAEAQLPFAVGENPQQLSGGELLEKLSVLWGKKLGAAHSKEAKTARWVFSALCDFNGKLQARDLVRFLFYAAQGSSEAKKEFAAGENDRILLPSAIRQAVTKCSHKKVKEATDEIEVLRNWHETLQTIDNKMVPFEALHTGLNTEQVLALQALGIIFEDTSQQGGQRFYVPESYRIGLGFGLAKRGRPKVLALIQRNLETADLILDS